MLSFDSKKLFGLGIEAMTDAQGRDKAICYFNEALENDNPYAPASYMLGVIYENCLDLEAAFKAYERAIDIDKTFTAAWLALEKCHRLGRGTPRNEALSLWCKEIISQITTMALTSTKPCTQEIKTDPPENLLATKPSLAYSFAAHCHRTNAQEQYQFNKQPDSTRNFSAKANL